MGLDARRSMTLPSPFDYGTQSLLYVPRNVPQPSSPAFTDAVFEAALPVIEAAGGGVFFLCTTLRAVDRIAGKLRDVNSTVATFGLFGTLLWLPRWFRPEGKLSGPQVIDEIADIVIGGLLKQGCP